MAKRKKKTAKQKQEFSNRPLAELKKLETKSSPIPSQALVEVESQLPQASKAQENDQLFLQAMQDVRPLNSRSATLPSRPRHYHVGPSFEQEEEQEVMQTLTDLVGGEQPFSLHETSEAIEGFIEGLDPRIVKRLRRGEYSVQDHLDLHGFTKEEAREKVERFLSEASLHGKRCVLIIHGRGHGSPERTPILKQALRNWFTRRGLKKRILAFTTARPCDGGAGAIYVLLKKKHH